MRVPTVSLAAGLLIFAATLFAVNVTSDSARAGSRPPVACDASRTQDAAAPQPGTRCTREKGERCKRPTGQNSAPQVSVRAAEQKITLGCPEGQTSQTCTPSASQKVQLTATATDPDDDMLLYTWTATGGRITGDNGEVTWDLTGLRPGTYTANVEVDDICGCVAFSSVQIKVEACSDCKATPR